MYAKQEVDVLSGRQCLKMQSPSGRQTHRQAVKNVKKCHFVIFTRQPGMLISGRWCLKRSIVKVKLVMWRPLSVRLQFMLAAATVAALILLYVTDCSPK